MKLIEANTKTINNITAILSGEEREQHETKVKNRCANCDKDVGNIFNVNHGKKFCNKACENIYFATAGVSTLAATPKTQMAVALRL